MPRHKLVTEKGGRRIVDIRVKSGVTPSQEGYCRARAMGMNIEESIVAAGAGIKPVTARNWEKQPIISKRIAELSEIATNNAIIKTGLDREWVISRLMSVTERCMQAEPVVDKEGAPIGEYKFDSNGATKALELLGKTINLFDPKNNGKERELENLSDDDIARIVGELASQTGLNEVVAGTQTTTRSGQVIEVQALPAPA